MCWSFLILPEEHSFQAMYPEENRVVPSQEQSLGAWARKIAPRFFRLELETIQSTVRPVKWNL